MSSLCPGFILEAIPIPADQPIMQIKDLEEVVIPTMEIKVKMIWFNPIDSFDFLWLIFSHTELSLWKADFNFTFWTGGSIWLL